MSSIWRTEKQPPKYYFAYGMNTNINEMAQRCPGAVNIGKCVLKDYELKFRLHADIDSVPGSEMQGVLWEITEDCERALDSLEGYPYYYDKINVVVESSYLPNKMTHAVAMAYIMTNKEQESPPSVRYENCLIEGYTANSLDVEKLTVKIESVIINQDGYV
jgi:hypothetical protein